MKTNRSLPSQIFGLCQGFLADGERVTSFLPKKDAFGARSYTLNTTIRIVQKNQTTLKDDRPVFYLQILRHNSNETGELFPMKTLVSRQMFCASCDIRFEKRKLLIFLTILE